MPWFLCHRGLLAVLALGLVLRLALLAFSGSMALQIADERQYVQLASNLASGQGFRLDPARLTSMRPPLYPFVVAGVFTLAGGEDLQAVRAAQVLIGLLVVVATYALSLRMFGTRVAIVAAAVTCFYPSLVFSGLLLLTELLFTLLVLLFVLAYDRTVETRSTWFALGAGVALGCSALTRSVLWPFPIVLTPLMLWSLPGGLRPRVALVGCCWLGFAIAVGPWAVRNSNLQRTFTVVDTMGGMNLRMGNYAYTPEDRMWDAVSLTGEKLWSRGIERIPEAASWSDGQKDKWAQREALAYMASHPGTTLRRSVLKFADFWGLEREMLAGFQQGLYQPPMWFMVVASVAVLVCYPLVALAAAIGLFCVPGRRPATHALVALLIVFITGIHTVVFGHSRYHLPLVPFLSMYAAAAVVNWTLVKRRVAFGRLALAATACLALGAAWLHEVLFRDAEHVKALLDRLT